MKLNFAINKQQLERKDDEILASYSKNFVRCTFICEKPWCAIYKYALFVDVKGNKFVVDLGYGKKVQCKIPEKVLQGNYFLVSVFGEDRLTTTQQTVLVEPSGFSDSVASLLSRNENSDSDVLSTSSDAVDDDKPRLVTCLYGYTILKDPQHDEHLYL